MGVQGGVQYVQQQPQVQQQAVPMQQQTQRLQQQPVVINLVMGPNNSGLQQQPQQQQQQTLKSAVAAVPGPSDGLPFAHGHMQIAELSTTTVADKSAVPKPRAMRAAP